MCRAGDAVRHDHRSFGSTAVSGQPCHRIFAKSVWIKVDGSRDTLERSSSTCVQPDSTGSGMPARIAATAAQAPASYYEFNRIRRVLAIVKPQVAAAAVINFRRSESSPIRVAAAAPVGGERRH
jgi:hypothetical protein